MRKVRIVPVVVNDEVICHVKEMLASDRRKVKRYAANGKEIDPDKYEVGLIGVSVCNDQGEPLFTQEQYGELEDHYTIREYDTILDVMGELNFLNETEEDIAGK